MRCKLACLALALSLSHAAAVVVSGTDGTINTTGAGAGDGWNYVGTVGGASGIYLGSYNGGNWVMTAAHVGPSNFTLNATTYSYVNGSAITIKNPDNSPTDLIVFQIATPPPSLPNLVLADTAAFSGEGVVMVGNGRNRAASETVWYVDTGTTPNVWSTTSTPQSDATAEGYQWAAGNTKRWGDNTVSGTTTISYDVSGTMRTVHSIYTDFDDVDGEGQAATGDSGGGVFHLNDNGTPTPIDDFWELSGMMVTIATFNGQPDSTAVYGNLTYSLDISYYKDQIIAAVPEPGSLGLIGFLVTSLTLASRRQRRDV